MKFRIFAACAAALLSGTAIEPARADVTVVAPDRASQSSWLEATTRHFIILGDMPEAQLRRRAMRLEQFHSLLATVAPERSENRLLIYLTDGIDPIQQMAHMNFIAGYYVPTAMGAFAVSPETFQNKRQGWTPEVVLFHEYTHHMLLQSNDAYFPGWMTEGLAELFATVDIKDNGDIVVGAANQARAPGMFSMNRWPADRLLRSDSIKISKDEVIEKYTRGTLLVHYLLMDPKKASQFGKYITLVNHGTEPVAAGTQAFGDLKALDRALDVYRNQPRVPSVTYAASKIAYDRAISVRTLTLDEAAALPVRLESETDEDREHVADLLPAARRVAARYPGSAHAQQALGQVEYEAGNFAEAGAATDRALAINPENVMALLYKGRVLGQKAIASKLPADWSAARAQFIKANRLDPNYPWTFVLLYDSFGAAGVTPSPASVIGLRRAVVLAPQDEGVRVRMTLQMLKENDFAGAQLMIAPVAFSPHGKPDAPAARFYPLLAGNADGAALIAKATELKLPVNSFFPRKKEDKPKSAATGGAENRHR
jgi:tetratricopeptide (TPR) repeat protein